MKQIVGKVISTKMIKSAVVEAERLWIHPIYKKRIKRKSKYLVANSMEAKEGDMVIITECKPISKRKRYKIVKILSKE